MSPDSQNPRSQPRRAVVLLLVIGTVLLFGVVFSQSWFNLTFLRPTSGGQTLIFAAVSAITFLLLLTLTFVLARNLVKLFAERRLGVLGSKFRTRLVVGALLLSSVPVILLCFFAYGLLNRSIVKWYSAPAEKVRENTTNIAAMLERYAALNASAEAQAIAAAPDTTKAYGSGNFGSAMAEFKRHELTLQGGFALALSCAEAAPRDIGNCSAEASFRAPAAWPALRSHVVLPRDGAAPPLDFNGRLYILGVAPTGGHGLILTALPLPPEFTQTLSDLQASRRWYIDVASQLKQVRRSYIGILLLVTVLLLFASMWLAMFVAKLVTRPVAALAQATQEISRGNLDYRVAVTAADELGDLVTKFNMMAAELDSNSRQLQTSRSELQQANTQLEQRRQQIETTLENIPTGVLSVSSQQAIQHANAAFLRMVAGRKDVTGASVRELFCGEVLDDLLKLMRKADRMGSTTAQMELPATRGRLNAAVTVASLNHGGRRMGYVIVVEDLSDVVKAQRQAAWREVARRVAHEIKNPLTPIALSAERISRHLERGTPDANSVAVIRACAETIAGSVETVRSLVDEFAALARFPTAQPQLTNVNSVVESALGMFNGRLDGIAVHTFLSSEVPRIMLDADAMKRAIANLVDNAAEAMSGALMKEIHISTALLAGRDAVEIVVADTGHGVTADVKERLFLPYFSTKERGTGLGLAIVSRIIEEHHGSIRVEENSPLGTRFVIELPVAAEPAKVAHA